MSSSANPLSRLADWLNPHKKHAFSFEEGNIQDRSLLGDKGAVLCEVMRLGLPVPAGFTISVEGFKHCFGDLEDLSLFNEENKLAEECKTAVQDLEKKTGRLFGRPPKMEGEPSLVVDSKNFPLFLAVRSSSPISMPGMLETILCVGLTDKTVDFLGSMSKDVPFAMWHYLKFIREFGVLVRSVDRQIFEDLTDQACGKAEVCRPRDLPMPYLQHLVEEFKKIAEFPQDAWEQLRLTIGAVFLSWHCSKARSYRMLHGIPEDMGCAVVVQSMVFGGLNSKSGTGVCFTRNPSNGERHFFGEYWPQLDGEDKAFQTAKSLEDFRRDQPAAHHALVRFQVMLEEHFKDMLDIEFTVESGQLFIIQVRAGKRTPKAAVATVVGLVRENRITQREALLRLDPNQMDYFLFPTIDPTSPKAPQAFLNSQRIGTGTGSSFGAACGRIAFSTEDAMRMALEGPVILCREELSPKDIVGVEVAAGILVMRGATTSHLATIARSLSKPLVIIDAQHIEQTSPKHESTRGCKLLVDNSTGTLCFGDDERLRNGELITIDGSRGDIYRGMISTVPAGQDHDFKTVLTWAGHYKKMLVMASADQEVDVALALSNGADGIGCLSTNEFFLKFDVIDDVRKILLPNISSAEKAISLERIENILASSFSRIIQSLTGRRVTFKLMDLSVQSFFPDPNDSGGNFEKDVREIASRLKMSSEIFALNCRSFRETAPKYGCRGCRLAVVHPELVRVQARAIRAACLTHGAFPEMFNVKIILPWVVTSEEVHFLTTMIDEATQEMAPTRTAEQRAFNYRLGCMLQTPIACTNVSEIVRINRKHVKCTEKTIEFCLFQSDDLTELAYGMSKFDTSKFLHLYMSKHLVSSNPFQVVDRSGLGSLLEQTILDGRQSNVDVKFGLVGDHASDPRSVHFAASVGMSSLVCVPNRVPVAKIAAAQAAIRSDLTKQSPFNNAEFWHRLSLSHL